MILLSSHIDTVRKDTQLRFEKGQFTGLLDNSMGVLLTYLTISEDKTLAHWAKTGKLGVYHNQSEEWGMIDDKCPRMAKSDVVIVIDVCSGDKYKDLDFSLENISGFTDKEIDTFTGILKWEGFSFIHSKYKGNRDEEDEGFYFKGKAKVISFIIPIESTDDCWHRDDSTLDFEKLLRCRQGLKRLINCCT